MKKTYICFRPRGIARRKEKSLADLKTAGAELVAITANTEHIVWNKICDRFPLPVISIVDATVNQIMRD